MALPCGNTTRDFTGIGFSAGGPGSNQTVLVQQALQRAMDDASGQAGAWLGTQRCPPTCFQRTTSQSVVSQGVSVTLVRNPPGSPNGRVVARIVSARVVLRQKVNCKRPVIHVKIELDRSGLKSKLKK